MKPKQFVSILIEQIIEENLLVHRDLLENSKIATDPDWKLILSFFNDLGDDKKAVLYKLIRLIEVNTVASILAVLDGELILSDQPDENEISLIIGKNSVPINGKLLDTFWEIEGS